MSLYVFLSRELENLQHQVDPKAKGAVQVRKLERYLDSVGGSTPLNRGQAARAASTSHLGRLPRHLGISAGGTEKLNSSSTDQR
jgi:hypothetical protein